MRANVKDMDRSFEFDADCDEFSDSEQPIEVNYRKID